MNFAYEETFKFYCSQLVNAADSFHKNFDSYMDTYFNDRLHSKSKKKILNDSEDKLREVISCIAVIVNHYGGIPREDSKQYVIENILPDIFEKGAVILKNSNNPDEELCYILDETVNDSGKAGKAFEIYSKIYMLGTKSSLDI